MPWLPLYADRQDVEQILDFLNTDSEAAFIISQGPGRWKAVEQLRTFNDGRYCIWCHSGGPLPLVRAKGRDGIIQNPWAGWTQGNPWAGSAEEVTEADLSLPYFGPGHPAIIWFNISTQGTEKDGIGLSSFEWIGNHYRILGSAAPPAVEKWWQHLRRTVKKSAKRIPRSGDPSGPHAEIWALPSAYAKILAGAPRDDNPY